MTFEQALIDELEKIAGKREEWDWTTQYPRIVRGQILNTLAGLGGAIGGGAIGYLVERVIRRAPPSGAGLSLGAIPGLVGGYILGRHLTREKGEPMKWGRTLLTMPINVAMPPIGPFATSLLLADLEKRKSRKSKK